MANARKRELLNGVQIDQLIGMAETFERVFRFLADFMQLYGNSLREVKRIRSAIKKGSAPIHYDDLLARLPDEFYAKDLLERATLVKFELGRLWLQAENSFDVAGLMMAKEVIRKELKDMSGVTHNIKILSPLPD